MSNVGQGILTIAGTVVGAFFGAPQLGYLVGSLAGQALFPTQLPGVQGPRLTDTRTTSAMVGAPVMEVFGDDCVPGNVMYTSDVTEVADTDTVGGKGGPEQDVTSFNYYQTIAVGLCRGPMAGIRKIWENGKLVYDISTQRDDETTHIYQARLSQAAAYATTFDLYLGDETQLPDPTLEAELGIGEVPAFRGLMYIVYPQRLLQQSQGLRHPTFKFEVFAEGTLQCEELEFFAGQRLYPWTGSQSNPINTLNDHVWSVNSSGVVGTDAGIGTYDTQGEAILAMTETRGFPLFENGYSAALSAPAGLVDSYTTQMGSPAATDEVFVRIFYTIITENRQFASNNAVDTLIAEGIAPASFESIFANTTPPVSTSASAAIFLYGDDAGVLPDGYQAMTADGAGNWVYSSLAGSIKVQRIPRAPPDACLGMPPYPGLPGYCFYGDFVIEDGPWTYEPGTAYNVLQEYLIDGDVTQYPLDPVRPAGHADDNETFWTEAYDAAVADGQIQSGLVYGVDYPVGQSFGWRRTANICSAASSQVSIAEIIRQICSRVGLTDIDVSDLETRFVTGYVISRVMNARDAIEPLRNVGYFDIVDSGPTLKFPTRGKAPVRTLEDRDLGAVESDTEMPPAVLTRKMQDVDLPRQVRLHYRDPGRDYEESEQLSPTRLTTLAVNDVDVEAPMAISATQALQAAEVIWASAWEGRWIQSFSLGLEHCDLEPGDAVLVPVDGRLERVRLVAIDGPQLLRKCEGVRDDSDGYVSVRIAPDPIRPPQEVRVISPTTLLLMDLPALRETDNDAGIYGVAYPFDPLLSWSGARIYHSSDSGGSFTNDAAVTQMPTVGTLGADFATGDYYTWDDSQDLIVNLITGSFENRTDAEVIGGANSLALGRNGRWEIVQFGTAVALSPTQWKLSHLLRGRRGTEGFMGTHVFTGTPDQVVLVSGAGVLRLPLFNAQIGQEQIYKAVSIGANFADGTDQNFTPTGMALRPFAPCSIAGTLELNGDVTLTWIRRNRLGEEMQSGVAIPMSDTPESYEVEIYANDSPGTLLRTLSASSETATYTAAMRATDSGSPADSVFTVKVYQLSAVVGRGPAGTASIEVPT